MTSTERERKGSCIKRQGSLWKRSGRLSPRWLKRWFVLDSQCVHYYLSEKDFNDNSTPRSSLPLSEIIDVDIVLSSDSRLLGEFEIQHPSKNLRLRAETKESAEEWVRLITEASAPASPRKSVYSEILRTMGLHKESLSDVTEVHENRFYKGEKSSLFGIEDILTETLDSMGQRSVSLLEKDAMQSFTKDQLLQAVIGVDSSVSTITGLDLDELRKCFILYHKCFMDSSEELLASLIQVFLVPSKLYTDHRVCVSVRSSVVDFLMVWVEESPRDFNLKMKSTTSKFVRQKVAIIEGLEEFASQLLNALNRQRQFSQFTSNAMLHLVDPLDILSTDPLEIAEQLTLYEHELFSSIKPRELVNREWSRDSCSFLAPTVTFMRETWNKITFWISSEILRRSDETERRKVMRRFVRIGFCCLEMDNYWGAFEIASALSMSPVFRLKEDWNSLSGRHKDMFQKLQKATGVNGSHKEYRKALEDGQGKPMVPHLVLHLRDLFALDALDTFKEDSSIVFQKYTRQWDQLSMILSPQSTEYHRIFRNDILRLSILKSAEDSMTKDEMLQRSYTILPRKQ